MAAPIKQGFMEKRHHKGKIGKQWTKRWVLLYDISDSGIPRLETFDSEVGSSKQAMIIPLNSDVHKIAASNQSPKKDYTIDIVMGNEKVHTFAVETKGDQESWLSKMQKVANLGKRGSMTPPPPSGHRDRYDHCNPHRKLSTQTSDSSSIDSFQAEENTLYDSYDVKSYNVRIKDNDFTLHTLKLRGPYTLSLDSVKLNLIHPEKGHILYTWPYKYLRRYGRDKVSFSMEAGRKCQSGPGLVVFETTEGNDIFHQIQNFVNSISGSQPLNAAQKVKHDDRKSSHGSHEDLSSQVKKIGVGNENLPDNMRRSHSLTTNQPVTKTKEFKDKIAARRQQQYADTPIAPVGRHHQINKTISEPPDDIYSEVSDRNMLQQDQPRMPMPRQDLGEYDIAGDMIAGHGGSPAPPDSDEYDELNPLLYMDPKERSEGEAWRTFGRLADNIHTDNYVSGQDIRSGQARSGDNPRMPPQARSGDNPRMPPGLANDKRSVDSPKVRSRQEQRNVQQQQQPRQEPEESLYSIAAGPTTSISAVAQSPLPPPQDTGHEVYDHLNWSQKPSKPTPAPRKSDTPPAITRKPPSSKPRPPGTKHQQVPIYDHLDRQSKVNPTPGAVAAKPIQPVRQAKKTVDSNPTYGSLYGEEEKVPQEEAAYGTLFRNNQSPQIGVQEDESGYVTQAGIAQDLPNEGDYDQPLRSEILQMEENNGESLYDVPDMFNSI